MYTWRFCLCCSFFRLADTFYDTVEKCHEKSEFEYHDDRENASYPEIFREGVHVPESDAPRSASSSYWATSSTSDDDEPLEEMGRLPFYSGYFEFDHPVRTSFIPNDHYHCLLDYPPRKRVPIGPEYQAEIPIWGENTSNGSTGDVILNEMCITPNSESQPKAGDGRLDCRCPDRGSIRCVRLHIAEARGKLRSVLGQDTFMELGFNHMGEVVADKWTNEEEHLFHEVVYSNPVSLGRNFWDGLYAVFPSRTKMEIVSYYFNVFMLRKRAEQNRCDPMNVDSDNDEWQGSDNDGDDEGGVSDDDDVSGIESPDGIVFRQNELHVHEDEEDDLVVSDDAQETDENNSQGHTHKFEADSAFHFPAKKSDYGPENEVQDGSCTSSDSGASVQGAQTQNDGCHDWHDYILDPADAKAWDGYMNCPKSNVDFLPTCSMIEEVFGGDFDSKDKRW
ncbi:hypothetical protein RND81_08G144700 [Saponaria officinalis]|uniref:Myb-like domain-containing protein n=1 Tax=Saponaria officinalis TaxID=3572 RepID=A0AAW1J6H2_SAPOF